MFDFNSRNPIHDLFNLKPIPGKVALIYVNGEARATLIPHDGEYSEGVYKLGAMGSCYSAGPAKRSRSDIAKALHDKLGDGVLTALYSADVSCW